MRSSSSVRLVEAGDELERDADEQALQHRLAPGGVVEEGGAVGPERGGDQPGVVGAQRVVHEVGGPVAEAELGRAPSSTARRSSASPKR